MESGKIKSLIKWMLIAMLLFCGGCKEKGTESLIRQEAIQEIAENAGKDEKLRFLMVCTLPEAKRTVKSARLAVEMAQTQGEIALAVEDLRSANAELADVEKQIEDLQ
jgi:outer membrane lipoprotein-sorting protein